MSRVLMAAFFAASAAAVMGADCATLAPYVYRIELTGLGRTQRGLRFGGGFFLSGDGEFLTAYHLFEESPQAVLASVAVEGEGGAAFDRPIVAITAFSRSLDYVTGRVRLAGARVRVPALGNSVGIGDRIFGFTIQVPGPVGPHSASLLRGGFRCAEGAVSAVSPRQINAAGKDFFGPGSSGSPVFDDAGRVVSIALEMVTPNREARRPEYVYVSLPVWRAVNGKKLARPLSFAEFMQGLRKR